MAVPARVAIQTFHQPTNQPTNRSSYAVGSTPLARKVGLVGFSFNARVVGWLVGWLVGRAKLDAVRNPHT
jgi:hypothetical protein